MQFGSGGPPTRHAGGGAELGGAEVAGGVVIAVRLADPELVGGAIDDVEAGGAGHRLDAGGGGGPPVGGVAGELVLDEGGAGPARLEEPPPLVDAEVRRRAVGLLTR